MNETNSYRQKWSLLKKKHHNKCIFNELRQNVIIRCEIKEVYFNKLYKICAKMSQNGRDNVIAHASFYRVN